MTSSTNSRKLVVDTCVLCTAGDVETPMSRGKSCWMFLDSLVNSEHKAVLSEDLEEEWNNSITESLIHASTWRID